MDASPATVVLGGADGPHELDFFGVNTANDEENPRLAVLVLDNTPPRSALVLGNPVPGTGVPATLTATDAGAGVRSISYRVCPQGSSPPPFIVVNASIASFVVARAAPTYEIDYLSTDNVGNSESMRVQLVQLDTTPPQSNLVIGAPGYAAIAPQFVTSVTRFSLAATDAGSGVRSVSYRMFAKGTGVPPPPYVSIDGPIANSR